MPLTRHAPILAFAAVVLSGLVAGCGIPAEAPPATAPTSSASVRPMAAQPRDVAGFAPFSPTPRMLEIVEERETTTVVRHQYGEVAIPRNPSRVFADISGFPVAAFLGLNLEGVDHYAGTEDLPWFAAGVGDADAQELTGDIDVERVAALRPDLILASSAIREHTGKKPADVYRQLSKIAPTVVFSDDGFAYWEQAALDLGTAVGQTDVQQRLADFRAQLGPACAPLQRAVGDGTVEALNIFGTDYWRQGATTTTAEDRIAPAADTRWLFDYCGLRAPESLARATAEENFAQVSAELVTQVDADHLFVVTADADAEKGRRELLANPLWAELPAVRAGNVYYLPRLSATNAADSLHTISEAAKAAG